MKPLRDVEKTRLDSYEDAQKNSIHRSSLLVPTIPNTQVSISFLNHFLIKRKNQNIGLRLTAVDAAGARIISRLFPIDEPRVYTLHLQRDFSPSASSYIVEFFSPSNIVIPFPAVMVNHRGPQSYSTVHSFNRVLNDIFEDDEINTVQVEEGAIDIAQDSRASTFFTVFAGQNRLQDEIGLRFKSNSMSISKRIAVDIPRLTHQSFPLGSVFPEIEHQQGVLLIQQPRQDMFYGRLLVGQTLPNGDLSANHSYYDNSEIAGEYWDDSHPSHRTYPIIDGLTTSIRIYPIQSPSTLEFSVLLKDSEGSTLAESKEFELVSPGNDWFNIDINQLIDSLGVTADDVVAFTLIAQPKTGNTPMRINHQLVFSSSGLVSSINVSMQNFNILHSNDRTRTTWGQLIHSAEFDTWLAFANDGETPGCSEVEVKFFSETGLVNTIAVSINQGTGIRLLLSDVLGEASGDDQFIWYEVESPNYFLTGWSVSKHRVSGHCMGEHSF
jgi:hypothetical protein